MKPLVIVHGWSDESGSFQSLAQVLGGRGGASPVEIRLGDWVSMNDEVTLPDVADALQRAWADHRLPTAPRSVDVVVHSTGALVLREWMTRFHRPATVPIHRLLMLAPANFGSPLAHKGHSFIGRAIKGWGEPGFQTGLRILKALELGSPYTFDLAHKDLFGPRTPWYGPGRILCTVLVGDTGYRGIAAIANEDGSDGTVRISTANLNAARLTLHLDADNQVAHHELQASAGETAFGVVARENHSTIALKDRQHPQTVALILDALAVDDAGWPAWRRELATRTAGGGDAHRYQNTVVHLRDHLGHEVDDYFVEFYRTEVDDQAFEQRLYQRVIRSVHPYADQRSYRALYLDVGALHGLRPEIEATPRRSLFLSFLAMPRYVPSGSPQTLSLNPVGYRPVGEHDLAGLAIAADQMTGLFAAHRTLLVDAQVHRAVDANVFRLWRKGG